MKLVKPPAVVATALTGTLAVTTAPCWAITGGPMPQWRPETPGEQPDADVFCGVGRKP